MNNGFDTHLIVEALSDSRAPTFCFNAWCHWTIRIDKIHGYPRSFNLLSGKFENYSVKYFIYFYLLIFVFRTTTSSCCTIIGNDCQMLAKFGKFGRIWSQGVLHGSSESFHSEKQRKNGCVLGSFIRKLIYFLINISIDNLCNSIFLLRLI